MVATRKIEDGQTYVVVHHGDEDRYSVAHGREGVYRALLDILVDRSGRGYRGSLDFMEDRITAVNAELPVLRSTVENLIGQRAAIADTGVSAPELLEIVDRSIEEAAFNFRRKEVELLQVQAQKTITLYLQDLLIQKNTGTVDVLADIPEYVKKVAFISGAKNTTIGNFILHELLAENAATVETTTVFS